MLVSTYNRHRQKQRNRDSAVHEGPTSCFAEVMFACHCILHDHMFVREHDQRDNERIPISVRFLVRWN